MEKDEIKLKVIGIGGAGNNAINLLLEENLQNVELAIANSDYQDLDKSKCKNKIYLGTSTNGFGAGGNPEIGRRCAMESISEIEESIKDVDILVLTAGLGGGTGTGAIPVFAEAAHKQNILTLAVITTPFDLIEGSKVVNIASQGLENLKNQVDSYVVLSNQKLFENYDDLPIDEAFKVSNLTLVNTVKTIRNIIYETGKINLDFNDLKNTLLNGQETIIGVGEGFGKNRIEDAIKESLAMPLFKNKIEECKKMILFIECDKQTSLKDISKAREMINNYFAKNHDFEVVFGLNYVDYDVRDQYFKISIIATQINHKNANVDNKEEAQVITNLVNNSSFGNYQSSQTKEFDYVINQKNEVFESSTTFNIINENDAMPDFFKD